MYNTNYYYYINRAAGSSLM